MSKTADCNRSTILRICSNIWMFGSVKAPPNQGGRPRGITLVVLEVWCDYLLGKLTLLLDKMMVLYPSNDVKHRIVDPRLVVLNVARYPPCFPSSRMSLAKTIEGHQVATMPSVGTMPTLTSTCDTTLVLEIRDLCYP